MSDTPLPKVLFDGEASLNGKTRWVLLRNGPRGFFLSWYPNKELKEVPFIAASSMVMLKEIDDMEKISKSKLRLGTSRGVILIVAENAAIWFSALEKFKERDEFERKQKEADPNYEDPATATGPMLMKSIKVSEISCKGLKDMDAGSGESDPFVDMRIKTEAGNVMGDEFQYRTKMLKDTLDPIFPEVFEIECPAKVSKLQFQVYDEDIGGSKEFMGEVNFPLRLLTDGMDEVRELPMEQGDEKMVIGGARGTMSVRFQVEQFEVEREDDGINCTFHEYDGSFTCVHCKTVIKPHKPPKSQHQSKCTIL